MGGLALNGRRCDRTEGLRIAREVLDWLGSSVRRAEVCGSLRRGKAEIGDVEIVLLPSDGKRLATKLAAKWGFQKNGKPARRGLWRGVQVDVFISGEKDWGAQLLAWTGSSDFCRRIRCRAIVKGMKLNQYGLFRATGRRVAGKTEAEIFEKLGMRFLNPEEREVA